MKFKTAFNGPHKFDGEVGSGKSLTIPGQAQSVLELYSRFAKGLAPGSIAKEMVFDLEDDYDEKNTPKGMAMPDWERMDLAEREDFAIAVKKDIDDKLKVLQKMDFEKKKKAEEELAELRKLAKERKEQKAAEDKGTAPDKPTP